MKTCRNCGQGKPLSAFYKHNSSSDGLHPYCKECVKRKTKEWKTNNQEAHKQQSKRKYARHCEKMRQRFKEWRATHLDEAKAGVRAWYRANKHKVTFATAKRRAHLKQATPIWANQETIKLLYEYAALCSKVLDTPYHVDHVVPLQSKAVCGLHVSANLQVIGGADNLSKGNRYWPDMW